MIMFDAQRRAMFANINNPTMGNQFAYTPIYSAGDFGAMGVDAAGSAGSGVVAGAGLAAALFPPVLIGAGAIWGADKLRGTKSVEKLMGPKTKTLLGKPIKESTGKAKSGKWSDRFEKGMREPIIAKL